MQTSITAGSSSNTKAARSNRAASWLLRAGVVVVSTLALSVNPFDKPLLHIMMGVAILVIATWPLDRWLCSKERKTVPVFELHLLFFATCFGVAAFVTPPSLDVAALRLTESAYTEGLIATLVCIASLSLGYYLSRYFRGATLAKLAPRFPAGVDKLVIAYIYPFALALALLTKYLHIAAFDQAATILRLFAFTWALCAAWSGTVPKRFAMLTVFGILPVELLLFNGLLGGTLVGLLAYGELIVVCYAVCRGRILVWVAVFGIVAFAILQPIKAKYRSIVWGQATALTVTQRADLLTDQAIGNAQNSVTNDSVSENLQAAYARLDHLAVTSAVVQATQRADDYVHGSTLLPILTKWIPRVLWPGKPKEDIGNSWAHRYGFLAPNDYDTSFNLPWLPEMFMNFGWPGIVGISIFLGYFMRLLKRGIIDKVRMPVEIAFAYTIASVFFWPESNMSAQLGSIVTSWITVSVLLVSIRMLTRLGRSPSRKAAA